MHAFIALLSGLLFGIGLIFSGMTNPSKVIGFLDLFGAWDPSLAFVMMGAIFIGIPAFKLGKARSKALLGNDFSWPHAKKIDSKLVFGSLVFGTGWGLAGFCPGPALVSLSLGAKPLIFVFSMLAGMALFEVYNRLISSR